MTTNHPNIIILVLDTVRAQNLSCYGYSRETSPNIDHIASEGIRFKNAYANAPWTLPSHASMFTGLLPFDHGANARNYRLVDSVPTLAERLRANGYDTTLISNNGWLSDGFGIVRGFENQYELWKLFQTETDIVEPYREYIKTTDLVHNPSSILRFGLEVLHNGSPIRDSVNLLYGAYHRDENHHSGERITKILKQSVTDADNPLFVVANYLEPHLRYFPPEPYRSQFLFDDTNDTEASDVCQDVFDVQFGDVSLSGRDKLILESLYNGEIAHVDSYVGSVYNYLNDRGYLDESYLFIVGDHGENIGDHGLLGHNSSLHDTVLKVPFIVRPPGGTTGQVVDDYVQLTDIYQTVINATGVADSVSEMENNFSYDVLGSSLKERPNFAISQYAGLQLETDRIESDYPDVDLNEYDRPLISIREGDHTIIRDSSDNTILTARTETRQGDEVQLDMEATVDRLTDILDSYNTSLDEDRSSTEISSAIKNRLKDLGYHK